MPVILAIVAWVGRGVIALTSSYPSWGQDILREDKKQAHASKGAKINWRIRVLCGAGAGYRLVEVDPANIVSGVIFGATGGVMEAALRSVLEFVTGKQVENFYDHADIIPVRGKYIG
jgi:hypothetical protein